MYCIINTTTNNKHNLKTKNDEKERKNLCNGR
jgi:hypothetical protein